MNESISDQIALLINQFIKKLTEWQTHFDRKTIKFDKRIKIGRYSYGFKSNTFLLWNENEKINIGSFCSIANNVKIFGGGEHFFQKVTTFPLVLIDNKNHEDKHSKGETNIGNDVWIGENAIILSGVKVSDGTVIGAGSVVTNNTLPYSIVAGNPAKTIKMRFDKQTIEKLLKIKWWNWEIERIRENISFFENTKEFVKKFANEI